MPSDRIGPGSQSLSMCECSCRPTDTSGYSRADPRPQFDGLDNDIARQALHKRFHFNHIVPESRLACKLRANKSKKFKYS